MKWKRIMGSGAAEAFFLQALAAVGRLAANYADREFISVPNA
jgi:hypothetical protein